jgi:hypothetical protein
MSYIKRFNYLKEYFNFNDLKTLLPDENKLIDMIDTRLLDGEFRQVCQDHGYLQLAASKLVSEKYDLSEGSVAILSSLESRFTFDKTVGGLKKLKERLGRESNIDSILDDIEEIERNNQVEIDTDKQHVIFTTILFDLMLVKNGNNIIVKVESRFQVNYDEFVSVLVPVEEEIVLSDKEISKDHILRLVDFSLKKLKEEVINDLTK